MCTVHDGAGGCASALAQACLFWLGEALGLSNESPTSDTDTITQQEKLNWRIRKIIGAPATSRAVGARTLTLKRSTTSSVLA